MNETHSDCRSEEGITIGLIDSIMSISAVLANRDLSDDNVQQALEDLRQNEHLQLLLSSHPINVITVSEAKEKYGLIEKEEKILEDKETRIYFSLEDRILEILEQWEVCHCADSPSQYEREFTKWFNKNTFTVCFIIEKILDDPEKIDKYFSGLDECLSIIALEGNDMSLDTRKKLLKKAMSVKNIHIRHSAVKAITYLNDKDDSYLYEFFKDACEQENNSVLKSMMKRILDQWYQ